MTIYRTISYIINVIVGIYSYPRQSEHLPSSTSVLDRTLYNMVGLEREREREREREKRGTERAREFTFMYMIITCVCDMYMYTSHHIMLYFVLVAGQLCFNVRRVH